MQKLECRSIGIGVALAAIWGLTQAASAAAYYEVSGSFRPTPGVDNIVWTGGSRTQYFGSIYSSSTPGIANGELKFDSMPELSALGALPVRAVFGGSWDGQVFPDEAMALADLYASFIYEGASPLIFGGVSYAEGTVLLQIGNGQRSHYGSSFDNGCGNGAELYSPVFDFQSLNNATGGWCWGVTPSPVAHHGAGPFGTYVYVDGGQGSIGANFFSSNAPEPLTWTLMTMGFGMLGAVARRSRRKASLAVQR